MDELSVFKAQHNDAAAIAAILTAATEHKVALGDNAWGSEPWSEAEVKDEMAKGTMYIAKLGDEPVGTVSLQWDDARNWGQQPPVAGYIHRLAVKDGFHGQNLGRRIIDWAAKEVALKGKRYLRLDCSANNTNLCRYYEGLGFQQTGTKHYPENGGYNAALFERHLVAK